MLTYLNRASFRSLLLSLTLVLALSEPVLAQGLSPSVLMLASASRGADPVGSASVEHLPSAPMVAGTVTPAPLLAASPAAMAPAAFVPVIVQPNVPARHRFWDRENLALFATVSAFAAADFCTTRANLTSGGKELNPVTRVFSGSTQGLAANFALEAGGVMAVSYLFHKTGHHKLERITSFVNIGASATAVGYSLAHR